MGANPPGSSVWGYNLNIECSFRKNINTRQNYLISFGTVLTAAYSITFFLFDLTTEKMYHGDISLQHTATKRHHVTAMLEAVVITELFLKTKYEIHGIDIRMPFSV